MNVIQVMVFTAVITWPGAQTPRAHFIVNVNRDLSETAKYV